jgi:hypothetical protein
LAKELGIPGGGKRIENPEFKIAKSLTALQDICKIIAGLVL